MSMHVCKYMWIERDIYIYICVYIYIYMYIYIYIYLKIVVGCEVE